MAVDDKRKEFEEWNEADSYPCEISYRFAKDSDGDYTCHDTGVAWSAWQARGEHDAAELSSQEKAHELEMEEAAELYLEIAAELAEAKRRLEELEARYKIVRKYAIHQDAGRMCDNNANIQYSKQLLDSEKFVDSLVCQVLSNNNRG